MIISSTWWALSAMIVPLLSSPLGLSLFLLASSINQARLWGHIASPWLAAVLVLVFAGGMMVMLMYISSLAVSPRQTPFIMATSALAFTIILAMAPEYQVGLVALPNGVYLGPSSSIFLFLTSFLLTALILVVKISQSFKGSILKQF